MTTDGVGQQESIVDYPVEGLSTQCGLTYTLQTLKNLPSSPPTAHILYSVYTQSVLSTKIINIA